MSGLQYPWMRQEVAARHNTGKPELGYIETMPLALAELTRVFEMGAKKYERHNYLKGAPDSQYANSGARHRLAYVMGEDADPESTCHHLAHEAWNVLMRLELAMRRGSGEIIGGDDRPQPLREELIDAVLRRERRIED